MSPVLPDSVALAGGLALTWPALRAGRMLGRAASAAKDAQKQPDSTSKSIYEQLRAAYLADSWRKSDQRLLWIGLILMMLSSGLTMYEKLAAAGQ